MSRDPALPSTQADPMSTFTPARKASPVRRALTIAMAASIAALASACATPSPPPTEQIAAATAAVVHAAGSGGNELAPQYMQMARSKLQRANAASTAQAYPLAIALAGEAKVDAQLAEARAEAIKARQTADAAREGNRVLREEIQRKTP
jgi:Domain of unknown function (DUF4398)